MKLNLANVTRALMKFKYCPFCGGETELELMQESKIKMCCPGCGNHTDLSVFLSQVAAAPEESLGYSNQKPTL